MADKWSSLTAPQVLCSTVCQTQRRPMASCRQWVASALYWTSTALRPVCPLSQSAVTALHFNGAGALLASGAKDTDVIVWDVVGEIGLFRLRGHTDQASLAVKQSCIP